MLVVILAGGRGSRLGRLTENKPKCMVGFNGRPFLDYQLKKIVADCSLRTEIIISTGYKEHVISNYIRASYVVGNSPIIYTGSDGDKPLGTLGALKNINTRYRLDDRFMLLYGDVMPRFNLLSFWKETEDVGSVMSIQHATTISNVHLNGNSIDYYGAYSYTAQHLDAGVSILKKKDLKHTSSDSLEDLFNNLSIKGLLSGYPVFNPSYEIGSLEGLKTFKNSLKVMKKQSS